MSMNELSPREIYEFIVGALHAQQVPYIAGPPGIGKSQILAQVAEGANAKLIDVRLSQMLSEDITGIPERDKERNKAIYLPFETFPLEGDPIPDGYDGWIVLLDELSSASEEILAATYSIILDRTAGGRKLHPKCLIVAAGNRSTDSAIARRLPDTLITRMLPATMKTNIEDWKIWAKQAKHRNDTVIDFLTHHSTLLHSDVNQENREELESYPTPRGWEKVMQQVNLFEATAKTEPITDSAGIPIASNPDTASAKLDYMTQHLIYAAVGPIAGKAFVTEYNDNAALPFPWEIAASPSSTRIPVENAKQIKLTKQLAEFMLKNAGNQTQDALLIYVNRMGPEMGEIFYNKVDQTLGQTPSDNRLRETIRSRLNIDLV